MTESHIAFYSPHLTKSDIVDTVSLCSWGHVPQPMGQVLENLVMDEYFRRQDEANGAGPLEPATVTLTASMFESQEHLDGCMTCCWRISFDDRLGNGSQELFAKAAAALRELEV